MGLKLEKKLEIINGEGKEDPLSRLLRLGSFGIDITKKSIKFGMITTAEIGSNLMYGMGQKGYASTLRLREPRDRAVRGLRTAHYALDAFAKVDKELSDRELLTKAEEEKRNKLLELGRFSALDFAAANEKLEEIDPQTAIENTPEVITLIEKIPDTVEDARAAEQIIAQGLAPIINDFHARVRPFPTQRDPID